MPRPFTKAEVRGFARLKRTIPEPRPSCNRWATLLVAVVLSAQATDKSVNKRRRRFSRSSTRGKMVARRQLREYIKTIGLYRGKAKNVIALSKLLIERHNSVVPRTRGVQALPGAGRKTANVAECRVRRRPSRRHTHLPCLQPHQPGARQRHAEGRAGFRKVVPDHYKLHAHRWLILHALYFAWRAPLCPTCVVRDLPFKHKTKEWTCLRRRRARPRRTGAR